MASAVFIMSVGPGFKELDFYSTVESCLIQSIETDLFIYFDGVSPTDDIIKLMNENSITFFSSKVCQGLPTGLNYLINQICACKDYEFVLRIDCGDINMPCRAEKQVDFLRARVDIDVVGSQAEIYQDGVFQAKTQYPLSSEKIISSLRYRNPLIHPSIACRARLLRCGFRYDSKMIRCQDYKLWIDLAAAGRSFENLDDALIEFHRDKNFVKRRSRSISEFEFMARIHAARTLGGGSSMLYVLAGLVYVFRQLPSSWINLVYSLKK